MNDRRYQTLWPRFCAGIIDIVVVLPFIVTFWVFDLSSLTWLGWGLGFATVAVNGAYFVFMHARSGQTIGKKIMKVRVVDSGSEGPITLRQSFWRESPLIFINCIFVGLELAIILMGIDDAEAPLVVVYLFIQRLPNLWVLADAVTALFSPKSRSLHDHIGGTVVVKCRPPSLTV